jgi:hypothetical protein
MRSYLPSVVPLNRKATIVPEASVSNSGGCATRRTESSSHLDASGGLRIVRDMYGQAVTLSARRRLSSIGGMLQECKDTAGSWAGTPRSHRCDL